MKGNKNASAANHFLHKATKEWANLGNEKSVNAVEAIKRLIAYGLHNHCTDTNKHTYIPTKLLPLNQNTCYFNNSYNILVEIRQILKRFFQQKQRNSAERIKEIDYLEKKNGETKRLSVHIQNIKKAIHKFYDQKGIISYFNFQTMAFYQVN